MDVPDGTQTPTSFCSVPVVDFSAYGLHVDTPDEEKLQELSKELHQKLVTVGFVHLTNVGISPEIVSKSKECFLKVKTIFASIRPSRRPNSVFFLLVASS